jgi:hypothetical protein
VDSEQAQPIFAYTGQRYLLGYTEVQYGIWDRNAPGAPVRRFPRTDDGWRTAAAEFASLEPSAQPVATTAATAAAAAAPPQAGQAGWDSPGSAPTTAPLPAALPFRLAVSPDMLLRILRATAWVALVVLPITGIAFLSVGGGFATVMNGLTFIVLGAVFWSLLLVAAEIAERLRGEHSPGE